MAMNNTNAAGTQQGFHYQDMVGLILILDNLSELKYANIEGTDDIDIGFDDGSISYYQVKEVNNPNSSNTSQKLKEALKTLETDAHLHKVRWLVYVSNAYQPLGVMKDSKFFNDKYSQYNFYELPSKLQKKVTDKLSDHTQIRLDKIRIMKIQYSGSDDKTKQLVLNERVDDFVDKASLNHKRNIKNEWLNMISRSTENPIEKITKKKFYAHTVVAEAFTVPRFGDFFENFDIDPSNEEYIRKTYDNQVTKLLENFELYNSIKTAFIEFAKDDKSRQLSRQEKSFKFVNDHYQITKDKLGISKPQDDDIAKIITWIAVKSFAISENVKEAMKNEDR